MDELKADLPTTGSDLDLVVASQQDVTIDHCMPMGTVWGCPCVVGMFGIVSGAAVLAAAGRESVSGHGGKVVASPGSSGDILSAGHAGSRTTGSDSPVS